MKTAHCFHGCGHFVPVDKDGSFITHDHNGQPALRSSCNGSGKSSRVTVEIEVVTATPPTNAPLTPQWTAAFEMAERLCAEREKREAA